MIRVSLDRPWLIADLGAEQRILSFAPWRPGFVLARQIVWREVRDADLSPEVDVNNWFADCLESCGFSEAVGMITSRDVSHFVLTEIEVEGNAVSCLATVGLGNAESVGSRRPLNGVGWSTGYGTINLAVQIEEGLTEAAQIEALTIATQARTAAILDCGLRLPDGRRATGTGTDCIAVAAAIGTLPYCGLHTAMGEAIGRAVRTAVSAAAQDWLIEHRGTASGWP